MRINRLFIGCIADDFTGGSDAASFLKKAGLRTVLLNGINSCTSLETLQPEAVVVALKSRSIPAEHAVAQSCKAAKWLLDQGAQHLYFKYCSTFDSTPKGNIGPVTDALMELLQTRYTVLCPALPINGRTVRDGILYVNGVPLEESPMRDHPLNPMKKSNLSELMEEQSQYPCIILNEEYLQKTDPIADYAALGRLTAVPPYETDEDGWQIAAKFASLPLLTGGSGLLEHLGRRYKFEQAGETPTPCFDPPDTAVAAPRLLLAGSCSEMTQKQVNRYLKEGGRAIRIEPDKLLSGQQREEDLYCAINELAEDILFYSTADTGQVAAYQAASAKPVSALIEGLMGRLAVYGRAHGYIRIMVAGGETSGAVMQALDANAYYIGKNAAPGVPELWPVDQPDLCMVLKSGNFGDETFFLTVLK